MKWWRKQTNNLHENVFKHLQRAMPVTFRYRKPVNNCAKLNIQQQKLTIYLKKLINKNYKFLPVIRLS